MKAILSKAGSIASTGFAEVPTPKPGPDEVLIATRALSINPVDWKAIESGWLGKETIPGTDVAGVIEAVGSNVKDLLPGMEVLSYPGVRHPGTFAEYVLANANAVATKPKNVSFEMAACLPVVGLTAWQGLIEHDLIQPGTRVLVHAAAGGVGHMAVQLAKLRGAYVIGTASANNHMLLKRFGCDEVVDYKKQDFKEVAKEVDVVMATIGGNTLLESANIIKPGGAMVIVAGHDKIEQVSNRGFEVISVQAKPNGAQLQTLVELLAQHKIMLYVDETVSWKHIKGAFTKSKEGHVRGKIAISLAP